MAETELRDGKQMLTNVTHFMDSTQAQHGRAH